MPSCSELARQDEDREADRPVIYQPVELTEAGVEALRLAKECGPKQRPPIVPRRCDILGHASGQAGLWAELCNMTNERDALLAKVADLESQLATARAITADFKAFANEQRERMGRAFAPAVG